MWSIGRIGENWLLKDIADICRADPCYATSSCRLLLTLSRYVWIPVLVCNAVYLCIYVCFAMSWSNQLALVAALSLARASAWSSCALMHRRRKLWPKLAGPQEPLSLRFMKSVGDFFEGMLRLETWDAGVRSAMCMLRTVMCSFRHELDGRNNCDWCDRGCSPPGSIEGAHSTVCRCAEQLSASPNLSRRNFKQDV